MPKKTKKEKLLAQHHRSKLAPVEAPVYTAQTIPPVQPASGAFSLSSLPASRPAKPDTRPHEYQLVKRDLIKTVVLTTVILVSEFLLSQSLPR